jgi:FKBP-type peptidyl-prolyl cis-trans isomerase FkpA
MSENLSVLTLDNGLVIEEIELGDGAEAQPGQTIIAHYKGYLENGDVFDSSEDGEPLTIQIGVGQVIEGWDVGIPAGEEIGVEGMRVGGRRRLVIPSQLAYGEHEIAGIPANSTLIFEIELVDVLD